MIANMSMSVSIQNPLSRLPRSLSTPSKATTHGSAVTAEQSVGYCVAPIPYHYAMAVYISPVSLTQQNDSRKVK